VIMNEWCNRACPACCRFRSAHCSQASQMTIASAVCRSPRPHPDART
jgi:hypothetical protein